MLLGLRNQREVALPAGWRRAYATLTSTDDELSNKARALAVLFGDEAVLPDLRATLADRTAAKAWRQQALAALVRFGDDEAAPVLHGLLEDPGLRREALDALAAFDHPDTPGILIRAYGGLSNAAERRAAVRALTSRAASSVALLEAVGSGALPADLLDDATTRRQLAAHRAPEVQELLASTWGVTTPLGDGVKARVAAYKKKLTKKALAGADLPAGRELFNRTCMVCHKLFGFGGDIGPDITGSNRADLDYILTNIVDPASEVAKAYMVTVVETADGRLVSGFIADENDQTITLQGAEQRVTVARADIAVDEDGAAKIFHSTASLMPPGQLDPMTDEQVRDLIAYLASPEQVALPDRGAALFNGEDLTGWTADADVWRVEAGEIIGHTAEGLGRNNFAVSDFPVRDFRLTLQVKLSPNTANSGIQFRSARIDGGQMRGYQADIGAGWWGKLYDEHGRGLLAADPRDDLALADQWNTYEILAVGQRIQLALNGQRCVDFTDESGVTEGVIGLQVHSGGPMEVRFRDLRLEVDPEPTLKTTR